MVFFQEKLQRPKVFPGACKRPVMTIGISTNNMILYALYENIFRFAEKEKHLTCQRQVLQLHPSPLRIGQLELLMRFLKRYAIHFQTEEMRDRIWNTRLNFVWRVWHRVYLDFFESKCRWFYQFHFQIRLSDWYKHPKQTSFHVRACRMRRCQEAQDLLAWTSDWCSYSWAYQVTQGMTRQTRRKSTSVWTADAKDLKRYAKVRG